MQSGLQIAVHRVRDLVDELAIDAASAALVGMRRIREAIAQHPLAARERRPDEIVDVHLARAEHEQRFGRGADVFFAALQHQRADAFGDLGATRLARGVHGEAAGAQ